MPFHTCCRHGPVFIEIIFGYHMTKDEWVQSVSSGAFTDDDGIAHLATRDGVSTKQIMASDVTTGLTWPGWASHIVWYIK